MDWNAAIEKHSEALKRIVVTLFAMAGLREPFLSQDDAPPQEVAEKPTLPRHLYRAILRLLRPAESAARRLIIVAARSISVPPQRPHTVTQAALPGAGARPGTVTFFPQNGTASTRQGASGKDRPPRPLTLPLFDRLPLPSRPRRSASTSVPRIWVPGYTTPFPVPVRLPPSPNDPIDAARVTRRLEALSAVLDDLPRHARRFARWRARCDARLLAERTQTAGPAQTNPRGQTRRRRFYRIWPLRGGRPPGARNARRPSRPVDDVVNAVHGLAFWALESPDTS